MDQPSKVSWKALWGKNLLAQASQNLAPTASNSSTELFPALLTSWTFQSSKFIALPSTFQGRPWRKSTPSRSVILARESTDDNGVFFFLLYLLLTGRGGQIGADGWSGCKGQKGRQTQGQRAQRDQGTSDYEEDPRRPRWNRVGAHGHRNLFYSNLQQANTWASWPLNSPLQNKIISYLGQVFGLQSQKHTHTREKGYPSEFRWPLFVCFLYSEGIGLVQRPLGDSFWPSVEGSPFVSRREIHTLTHRHREKELVIG